MGQLPQGSSAILVTPTIWSELLLAVDSLQRRDLRPVVVLLMSQSFGSRASNEDLAKSLAERNVPVCRVYCDADLSDTLSSFTTNTFSQDLSWRSTRVITLDLNFQGRPHAIASYLIRHPGDGVVLIESGPGSTLPVA